jgi:amino acid permease
MAKAQVRSASALQQSLLSEPLDSEGAPNSPIPTTDELQEASNQGSIRGSIANLSAGIVGAGTLGLPHAFLLDSPVVGSIFIVFIALLCRMTIRMLLDACAAAGMESYADLGKTIYGSKGLIVVDCTIFLLNFGICITYVVLIGVRAFSSLLFVVCCVLF